MKQITPNLIDVLRSRFVAQLAYERKFLRYWGTEMIGDVEVFKQKRTFYKNMDEDMEKLAKLLGLFDQLSAKQEGIKSAWLYLNPAKADDSLIDLNSGLLADNMTKAIKLLTKGSIIISAKYENEEFTSPPITSAVTDQAAIKSEIVNNFSSYWNSGFPIFTDQSDGYAAIVLTYLLKSTVIPYTIISVEETLTTKTDVKGSNSQFIRTSTRPAWRVRLEFDTIVLDSGTDIVNKVVTSIVTREHVTDQIVGSLFDTEEATTGTEDPTPEEEPERTNYQTISPVTPSSNWLEVTETSAGPTGDPVTRVKGHYLKTSVWKNPTLSPENKIKYVNSCIDTGYRKKSIPWYAVIIAIAIIIIATKVAGPAGTLAATEFTGAYATLVLVAVTISVAAMYISLAVMAVSALGANHVATSLGTLLRHMSPLIRVAQVIALVAAFTTMLKKGAEAAGKKAAMEAGRTAADVTVTEIAVEITKLGIESLTGIPAASDVQLSHVTKMLDVSFGLYQDNLQADMQKDVKNYRSEIAALESAREQAEVSDVIKDLMAVYQKPLDIDKSIYADIYDKPYEGWATPYHTGNVQATTVSALWLSDQ
jgi:hypothetical protein